MSLTAISSLESGRSIFFMNATHNMCKNLETNVFALRSGNDSNSHQLARNSENKISHELDAHHV